jgi:hypothetical protein
VSEPSFLLSFYNVITKQRININSEYLGLDFLLVSKFYILYPSISRLISGLVFVQHIFDFCPTAISVTPPRLDLPIFSSRQYSFMLNIQSGMSHKSIIEILTESRKQNERTISEP